MFWEIFIMDVINGFLWGAILALGSAVAITYSKTCSKADRRELQDYVTKQELKSFKDDVKECINNNTETISQRIDDKYDTIIAMLSTRIGKRG